MHWACHATLEPRDWQAKILEDFASLQEQVCEVHMVSGNATTAAPFSSQFTKSNCNTATYCNILQHTALRHVTPLCRWRRVPGVLFPPMGQLLDVLDQLNSFRRDVKIPNRTF